MGTYYIDSDAPNDSANGTSSSTPWKRSPGMEGFDGSYSHAAGDLFLFKGGKIWGSTELPLTIANSGAEGNPDIYRTATSGEWAGSTGQAVFDAGDTDSRCIYGSEKDYFTVDNFHLTKFTSYGFENAGGLGVTIQLCTLDDFTSTSASGIKFSATGSAANGAIISGNDIDPSPASYGTYGIWLTGTCHDSIIANNTVQKMAYFIGVRPADADGTEIYGNILTNSVSAGGAHETGINIQTDTTYQLDGMKIYNNYVECEYGSAALEVSASSPNPASTLINVDIYNNVFVTDNAPSEFAVVSVWDAEYIEFYNNTIYAADYIGCNFFSAHSKFKNNIIYNGTHRHVLRTSGKAFSTVFDSVNDLDYNYYYYGDGTALFDDNGTDRTLAQMKVLGYEANGEEQNPDFVSIPSDLSLNITSDCIDDGVSDPGSGLFSDDYNGVSRPQGDGWDCGAYEFGVEGSPGVGAFMISG